MHIASTLGTDVDARLEAALVLARAAGATTLPMFRAGAMNVEVKGDGTPVTMADRAAEDLLRAAIRRAFPQDEIIGEEFGEQPGSSGYRWVLDPIDGTASFMRGVPLFGTLVAVELGEESVAGVIHLPALEETLFAARGTGAWHQRGDSEPARARVSGCDRLSEGLFLTTSVDYWKQVGAADALPALASKFRSVRGWGDCYAHVLLATGRAEACVEPMVHVWDVAPMTIILPEAGGACTNGEGLTTSRSRLSVASNGRVHRELLSALKEYFDTGSAR